MWKHHAIYESRPCSVIVTLGGHLYRILEVVLTTIPPKQCFKVISHTTTFNFFTICSKGEQKDTATTAASAQAPSIQQKQVDKIEAKHKYSFCTQSSHISRLFQKVPTLPTSGSRQPSTSQATQLLQQGKQCTKVQIQQTLPPLPQELNAMETIAS
jgi:hypothetical protein